MPVFVYRAADRRGQTIDGVMEAPDARAVVERLQRESTLPLDRSLAILEELAPNARVKAIVADLLVSVRGGASLSEALAKHHPRPFSRLYINMIRAGEKGGVLEITLRRLAEFLESRAAFTEAILSALAYPVVIFSVGIGAIVFLMTVVIPLFA